MGNCLRRDQENSSWGDDDDGSWESLVSTHRRWQGDIDDAGEISVINMEKEKLLGGDRSENENENRREVKITISKKELEQLVKKGLTIEQVLARIVQVQGDQHHRSWKPMLQSIPEVN